MASLDARLRHLIGIFGEGGPVPEALKDECVMLDGQRRDRLLDLERLDRRIDDLRSRAVDPGAIGASLRSFAECHQTLDRAGLKTALGSLVTRVVVQRGKHENRPNAREGGGSSEGQIQTRCIKVNIGVATSPGGSKVLTNLRLVSISGNAGSPIGATVRTPPRCSPSPCSGPRPPEQKSICALVPHPRLETRLQRALRLQAMLDSGEVESRAALSRLLGVSRGSHHEGVEATAECPLPLAGANEGEGTSVPHTSRWMRNLSKSQPGMRTLHLAFLWPEVFRGDRGRSPIPPRSRCSLGGGTSSCRSSPAEAYRRWSTPESGIQAALQPSARR